MEYTLTLTLKITIQSELSKREVEQVFEEHVINEIQSNGIDSIQGHEIGFESLNIY